MPSVTFWSLDDAPDGSFATNHTSQTTVPVPDRIFVPCGCNAWPMAGARSDGGVPADSVLYWASRLPAAMRKTKAGLHIGDVTILDGDRECWDSAGAGDGIRTRDIDLGKVALYQLSYSRSI